MSEWLDMVAAARDVCWAGGIHRGGYVWKNGAELVWECNEDCPHPTHETN